VSKERAWLFAAALSAYVGNTNLDRMILERTNTRAAFKGQVGEINGALRSGQRPERMEELIALLMDGPFQI
jgi:hypothetical protein